MTNEELNIVNAMKMYGGSFVKCLAEAAMHADPQNFRKIKETWPEYWKEYSNFVEGQKKL